MSKLWSGLLLLVILGGCVGPPRDRPSERSDRKPPVEFSKEGRQCLADLDRIDARFTPLPDRDFGNGCSLTGSVQLLGVGVPITNVTAIRCPLARALAVWTRDVLQPAARERLGSRVVRIESMGGYSCRNIVGGNGGGRSQHATGNAVDIAAFALADGRRITVRNGWLGDSDERAFLRTISRQGCRYFQTVLGPDYNAAHVDHLHFDLGGRPFCR